MSFLSFQLEKTGTNKDLLNSKQAFSVFFKHWQRTMYYPLLLKKWLPQVHWNYMNLANFTKKLGWIKKKYHHNILPWVTLSILKQMWNNYCLTYFLSTKFRMEHLNCKIYIWHQIQHHQNKVHHNFCI